MLRQPRHWLGIEPLLLKRAHRQFLLVCWCCCLSYLEAGSSAPAEDRSPHCPDWAKAGECTKNTAYMLKACAVSCAHAAPAQPAAGAAGASASSGAAGGDASKKDAPQKKPAPAKQKPAAAPEKKPAAAPEKKPAAQKQGQEQVSPCKAEIQAATAASQARAEGAEAKLKELEKAEAATKAAKKHASDLEAKLRELEKADGASKAAQKRAEDAEAAVRASQGRVQNLQARVQELEKVEATSREAQKRAEEAEVAAKKAQRQAGDAEARVQDLEKAGIDSKGLQKRVQDSEFAARAAEGRAEEAEVAAKKAQRQAGDAEARVQELEKAGIDSEGLQKRVQDAEIAVRAAEGRAEEAEAKLKQLAQAEAAAGAAQERAEQAEARVLHLEAAQKSAGDTKATATVAQERALEADARLPQLEAARNSAKDAEAAAKSAEQRAEDAEARVLQLESELKNVADARATSQGRAGDAQEQLVATAAANSQAPVAPIVHSAPSSPGEGLGNELWANATAVIDDEDAMQVCSMRPGNTQATCGSLLETTTTSTAPAPAATGKLEAFQEKQQHVQEELEDKPQLRHPVQDASRPDAFGSSMGSRGALLEAVHAVSTRSMLLISDAAVLAGPLVGLDVACIYAVVGSYVDSLIGAAEVALGLDSPDAVDLGPCAAACRTVLGAGACLEAKASTTRIAAHLRRYSDAAFAALAGVRPGHEVWLPSSSGHAGGHGGKRSEAHPSSVAADGALRIMADRILVAAWLLVFAYVVVWRGIIGVLVGGVLLQYVVFGPIRVVQGLFACLSGRGCYGQGMAGRTSVYDI